MYFRLLKVVGKEEIILDRRQMLSTTSDLKFKEIDFHNYYEAISFHH